jgi:hypothetical protein
MVNKERALLTSITPAHTMKNPNPSFDNNPNTPNSREDKIIHERIRQARNASNLALIATGISAAISLFGASAFLAGKVPQGAITTVGGLASSLHCIRLANDANDRLDKLLAEIAE